MFDKTEPLRVEYIDGRLWKLLEHFAWFDETVEPEGWSIEVPAGFVTDFASIPRIFWNILPPAGLYAKAALIHDWLYYQGCVGDVSVSREYADTVFLHAMEELGVSWFRRQVMYRAVRVFAGSLWAKRRTYRP